MPDGFAPPAPIADQARPRFTHDEFVAMTRAGAFKRFSKAELRGGEIYVVNAEYALHARSKTRLLRLLDAGIARAGLPLEAICDASVRFGEFTPEPDLFVIDLSQGAEADDDMFQGDRVRLVVEVADTSLADDLGPKRDAYARAGLTELWVANLSARCIHQFAEPKDGAYLRAAVAQFGEAAQALTIPGLAVDTTGLP